MADIVDCLESCYFSFPSPSKKSDDFCKVFRRAGLSIPSCYIPVEFGSSCMYKLTKKGIEVLKSKLEGEEMESIER